MVVSSHGTRRWHLQMGGAEKVGTGWGGFKHVFSGGNGIVYAIDPVVEARLNLSGGTTPASGGDLWWYRHVGWEDGSFRWGPVGKRIYYCMANRKGLAREFGELHTNILSRVTTIATQDA